MTTPSNEEGQPVTSPENGPDEVVETVETEGAAAEATDTELTETVGEAVADVDYSIDDSSEFDADTFAVEAPVLGDRPVQTVGRRKEAVVRVRLLPGSGQFTLNGKPLETYFPNKLHQQVVKDPLTTVEKTERFDIFANLRGGGTAGQAGALRLAIARALAELDAEDRPALKKAGFLTRDARAVERKKYGLKKARKAPQYSKR
ncbi:30S ribosomal protein S9 [Pseudonocardia sp. EC080619-01]|uniref:30S ribosomal protein S9 n=1 Tax=Pseudonocardia sp. EC080619-01 TaxID=1096856 RepID=UPI0009E93488|nr:30S ribosomal protein S9 [Pseudonocardia sp. EC080619-01]